MILMTACAVTAVAVLAAAEEGVYFQAHRGALMEAPENTLAAYIHAWGVPGAVPEVDVCMTADGQFICLHDETLARTTDAPPEIRKTPVSQLTLDVIRGVNAAAKMPGAKPQRVPLLEEVLAEMKDHPERQAYLDLKNVDLEKLNAMLIAHGVADRVIFVHGDPAECKKLRERFPNSRTMTWLSGSPDAIRRQYEQLAQTGFAGLSQLQFHLKPAPNGDWPYVLEEAFLKKALAQTKADGVALQIRPFEFDAHSLARLTGLGVRWFVTDEPRAFADALHHAANQ